MLLPRGWMAFVGKQVSATGTGNEGVLRWKRCSDSSSGGVLVKLQPLRVSELSGLHDPSQKCGVYAGLTYAKRLFAQLRWGG